MKHQNLKRCPFFGGAAQRGFCQKSFVVQCRRGKCCATVVGATSEEAGKNWNKRVDPDNREAV